MLKKIAAAVAAITLTAMLSGCGGGSPTAEDISRTALQPATEQTQTTQPQSGPLRTPPALPLKIQVDKTTPKFMAEALESGEPIIVFAYKENHPLSSHVKENLKKMLENPYATDIIFLALNIEKPEHVYGLVDKLGITAVPYVAFIDSKGYIVKAYSGYVDEKTLQQALYNLTGGILLETTANVETTGAKGSE